MSTECKTIDALGFAQLRAMERMNRKIYGLQRVGELLSNAANPAGLMPDVDTLIPIRDIDPTALQTLQTGCPGIFSGLEQPVSLESFREHVLVAYRGLFSKLDNHPWSRLGRLQDKLNRFQAKFTHLDLNGVQAMLNCVGAVCDAANQLPENIRHQQAVIDQYQQNFPGGVGQVLTAPMQAKKNQIDALKAAVEALAEP